MTTVVAFNKLALQLLSDMSSVFPKDLASAKAQVEAMIKHDQASTLPMVLFEPSGEADPASPSRHALGVDFEIYYDKLSGKNQKKVSKYFDELTKLMKECDDGTKLVSERMRAFKESNALEQIDELISDPKNILNLLQDPSQLTSLVDTMKQNPELSAMADQITANFQTADISQLMQAAAPMLMNMQFQNQLQ